MKKSRSFLIQTVALVLIYGLSIVIFSEISLAWSLIAGAFLVLVFVFVTLFPRFRRRRIQKFSIVEKRKYGDRIIRIKGLNAQQCADFLWGHMKLYDEEKGFAEWKPDVKAVDGAVYFVYPSAVGLSDFCNLYSFVVNGDYDSDVEGLEITGWYPMLESHSKKQEVPFNNKTLMLFRSVYQENGDFVYFVTEYNHVYKMDINTEVLMEVKDTKASYDSMPDWNVLVPNR